MTRLLKDSGIPWINQIPQNREVKKVKYTLLSRNENNNPIRSRDILSLTAKQGVIPLDEKEGGGNKPKEDYSAYKLAYPGDIVINSMNILSGSVGLSNYFGCVSPVYYMLRPSKANDDVRFFNYIFQTKVFQLSLLGLGNGILIKESDSGKFNTIRMRIPLDKFGNLYIPIPSSEEQKKISNYLDKKVGEIDSLYDDIEKQIEKLEEYKLSVISEAVTRGLNEDAELKESGIKRIGLMPKAWKTIRLKYASWLKGRIGWQGLRADEFYEEKDLPYLITGTDFSLGFVNWDTCVHITEERYMQDLAIHVKENDLLITKDGTIGKVAVAKNCPEKVSLNSGVFIIRNTGKYKYHDRFMYYLLKSNQFLKWFDLSNAGNSTIKHLNQEKFYNFQFAYPPIDEQKSISEYLDEKCGEINLILSKKLKQLDILDQYKKSLIYEYTTGKKEVSSNY